MRNLILFTLALQLVSFSAFASFGDTPKQVLDLNDGNKCYRFDDKVIFIQVHKTNGPQSISIGKSKSTSKAALQTECDKAKRNLILKEVEDSEFIGVIGSLVFVESSMSAPGTGDIIVYSLDNGSKKLSAPTDGGAIESKKNEVIFYQPTNSMFLDRDDKESLKTWKQMGCSDSWAEGGMGCAQYVKTILNLKTLKLTQTKEMKVQEAQ